MRHCLLVAVIVITLMMNPASAEQAVPLAGTALQNTITDKTFHGRYADGRAWTEYHAPNGVTSYREEGGFFTEGLWSVTDDKACYCYKEMEGAFCFHAVQNGAELFLLVAEGPKRGTVNATVSRINQGDTEHLATGHIPDVPHSACGGMV